MLDTGFIICEIGPEMCIVQGCR